MTKYWDALRKAVGPVSEQPNGDNMRRYNPNGCDVTDDPDLWSSRDCEINHTTYTNPQVHSNGQHTGGTPQIWIRNAVFLDTPAGPWINTGSHSARDVREDFTQYGLRYWSF